MVFTGGKGSGGRTTKKPEITEKPTITKGLISKSSTDNGFGTEHPTGTDGGFTRDYTDGYTDSPGHSTDDFGSKSSTDNGFGTEHPTGTDGVFTGDYTDKYTDSPGHSTDE